MGCRLQSIRTWMEVDQDFGLSQRGRDEPMFFNFYIYFLEDKEFYYIKSQRWRQNHKEKLQPPGSLTQLNKNTHNANIKNKNRKKTWSCSDDPSSLWPIWTKVLDWTLHDA